jgi:adenylate cyclase
MSDVLSAIYLEAEIDGKLSRFPLVDDRTFRIGRSDKNNVVLTDDLASRNHAMLQRSDEGQFYITDLGSSNGTFVNGGRISAPVVLRHGDKIRIGTHEFTFFQQSHVEPPPIEQPDELQSTNILFAQSLITVLVADIRDFTGLGRRLEASKLSGLTGTLFREGGKALQERGAWAQKYIGDAVMAVWLHKKRAPEMRELANVFEGLSRLIEIASGLQSHFGLDAPIRLGAGINTGWASVGNVGSMASSDYTALGDVVNKTFRLESATKEIPCDLALGQGTYEFLSGLAGIESLFNACKVKLKGYDEPATAYGAHTSAIPSVLAALKQSQASHG